MKTFVRGDAVLVRLPGGETEGVVSEVLTDYGFRHCKETKYLIRGKELESITSARCLRISPRG